MQWLKREIYASRRNNFSFLFLARFRNAHAWKTTKKKNVFDQLFSTIIYDFSLRSFAEKDEGYATLDLNEFVAKKTIYVVFLGMTRMILMKRPLSAGMEKKNQ